MPAHTHTPNPPHHNFYGHKELRSGSRTYLETFLYSESRIPCVRGACCTSLFPYRSVGHILADERKYEMTSMLSETHACSPKSRKDVSNVLLC